MRVVVAYRGEIRVAYGEILLAYDFPGTYDTPRGKRIGWGRRSEHLHALE